MSAPDRSLEARAALLKLAREATNGWACYAKRQIEHNEIARLHAALNAHEAALSPSDGSGQAPQEEQK
jgi:hypothetical protein